MSVQVDTNGLAAAVDKIREELTPHEDGVDHRAGILYTAAECLRQIDELERQVTRSKELYESAMSIVRRYQRERDGLLDRVHRALLGISKVRGCHG